MAKYRAIADLSLGANWYVNAGETIDTSDSRLSPGWIPPAGACDPIDAGAVAAYTAAGPQGQQGAEPNRPIYPFGWNRWVGVAYSAPIYRWHQSAPDKWVLVRG